MIHVFGLISGSASIAASQVLNRTPIRQQPRFEIMKGYMGMETSFITYPLAHFFLCIDSIAKVTGSRVNVSQCNHSIGGVLAAKEIGHLATKLFAFRKSSVKWHRIEPWHPPYEAGHKKVAQRREKCRLRCTF